MFTATVIFGLENLSHPRSELERLDEGVFGRFCLLLVFRLTEIRLRQVEVVVLSQSHFHSPIVGGSEHETVLLVEVECKELVAGKDLVAVGTLDVVQPSVLDLFVANQVVLA